MGPEAIVFVETNSST